MPKTPDSFPGSLLEDQICLYDQYGVLPDCYGGIIYSDGYFYMKDAYGTMNPRLTLPHINSHLGDGSDSLYVLSTVDPTVGDDGYAIGFRWINTIDGYEYVLTNVSPGSANWTATGGAGTGSGITESEHEVLDTLTHDIVENSYGEVIYSSSPSRISNLITWTDSGKTKKIREEQVTYSLNKITQTVDIQYDDNGVESYRITETYAYTNNKLTSVSRVRS